MNPEVEFRRRTLLTIVEGGTTLELALQSEGPEDWNGLWLHLSDNPHEGCGIKLDSENVLRLIIALETCW